MFRIKKIIGATSVIVLLSIKELQITHVAEKNKNKWFDERPGSESLAPSINPAMDRPSA